MSVYIRSHISIHKKRVLIGMSVISVLILLASPGFYFYNKYKETEMLLKNPRVVQNKKVEDIVTKISRHIQLPNGETPSLMTVNNKLNLANLPFFMKAENGDTVLIYEKAKMAYLYRTSTDQLINVAPISKSQSNSNELNKELGVSESTSSAQLGTINPSNTPSPTINNRKKITVSVRNGTNVSGLARTTADLILSSSSQFEISETTNAKKVDYGSIIVVVNNASYAPEAQIIASLLKGSIQKLPKGEISSSADIIVIVGK